MVNRNLSALLLSATIFFPNAMAQAAGPVFVWVEGEKPASTNITPHPWYSTEVKKNLLSGGGWLANFDAGRVGQATYNFNVPKDGEYTFWLRANPTAAKMTYQLNGGAETDISFAGETDNVNVASDGKIDLRFVAWIRVGDLTLKQGKNTIEFKTLSENSHHGAIDCFTFVMGRWKPEGLQKPGDATPTAQLKGTAESWAFDTADDIYKPDALLDLTSLNEKVAGESGFISRTKDGNNFARPDGTPIRFWSVVSGGADMNPADMEEHCRFLAKRGVNMVRLHLSLCNEKEGAKVTDVNEEGLDRAFRFISICKKHGIYVTLSPYWAHTKAPASWGMDDYAGQELWGIMFFNPKLQEGYRAWLTEMYTRKNPYTGVPLKDEPTIAIAQLQNEDSLLFYTFQGVKGAQKKLIGKQFADWATKKYGTLDKAYAAWDGKKLDGDDAGAGVLGFHLIWAMTQNPPTDKGERQRMADQTQFLGETQHAFDEMAEAHLHTLGCKQLVNAMNWRSADPVRLDDLERWTYTANEVSAVNVYTGGMHVGENNGYRIDPGHHYTDLSVLKEPEKFPGALKQTDGHPMIITESSWTDPNLYQSEGPFMVSAYLSLTGVDSLYWFSAGAPTWSKDPRRKFWKVGDSFALEKWSCSTPMTLGQFPAYAIAFRNGYIEPADKPVVYEERSLDDLYQRRVPIISEGGKFDPNRDKGSFAPQSTIKQEVDRLAFFVGPVVVKFGGSAVKNHVEDLKKYIDRAAGVVRSVTGQLALNYKQGLMTVDAPKFQGVSGFLKAAGGKFTFKDLTLASDNDYATVGVVSLDDKPLAESGKVLVQVGTTSRLTGWQSKPATFKAEGGDKAQSVNGLEIINTGAPPWQVVNTKVTLRIKNAALTKATLLDTNGYAASQVPVTREGNELVIQLPANAMYVVLQ